MKIPQTSNLHAGERNMLLSSENFRTRMGQAVTAAECFAITWVALAIINDLAATTTNRYNSLCQNDAFDGVAGMCPILRIGKELAAPAYHLMRDLGSFGVAWRLAAWVGLSKLIDLGLHARTKKHTSSPQNPLTGVDIQSTPPSKSNIYKRSLLKVISSFVTG